MADTEEPQFNTLAERIAALNKQKSFANARSPSPGPGPVRKRPPPPPPPVRPAIEGRSQTVPVISTTPSPSQNNPALPPAPLETGVNTTAQSAKWPRWCSASPASAPQPHPNHAVCANLTTETYLDPI
ncbi:hypothetical protein NXS19_013643 [Fusarium pseudograminearum]|nr:hypothetical protein NXS19_013643 [Fusarium pseudograminearum]